MKDMETDTLFKLLSAKISPRNQTFKCFAHPVSWG